MSMPKLPLISSSVGLVSVRHGETHQAPGLICMGRAFHYVTKPVSTFPNQAQCYSSHGALCSLWEQRETFIQYKRTLEWQGPSVVGNGRTPALKSHWQAELLSTVTWQWQPHLQGLSAPTQAFAPSRPHCHHPKDNTREIQISGFTR